jgi:hypothetical protein
VDYVTKAPAPLFLEIPLRVRYFYNIYKGKLHYVVYGGVSLLTNFSGAEFAAGEGQFTYTYPFNGSPAQATIRHTASRTSRFRPVLRTGTGLEYRIHMKFPLIATLYFNYLQGFSSTETITLSSTIPEGRGNGVLSYQGTGWSIDLGIKIPFVFGEGGICAPPPEREEEE